MCSFFNKLILNYIFSLSIFILSTSAFKLGKSDFAAKLYVLTPVAFLNQILLHN